MLAHYNRQQPASQSAAAPLLPQSPPPLPSSPSPSTHCQQHRHHHFLLRHYRHHHQLTTNYVFTAAKTPVTPAVTDSNSSTTGARFWSSLLCAVGARPLPLLLGGRLTTALFCFTATDRAWNPPQSLNSGAVGVHIDSISLGMATRYIHTAVT